MEEGLEKKYCSTAVFWQSRIRISLFFKKYATHLLQLAKVKYQEYGKDFFLAVCLEVMFSSELS